MSSGVFIDKEFSNRIELSRLDQDILKFHCFECYPPLGGGLGGWVGVWMGGGNPHTHAHVHAHARTRAHRTCMRIDMIISCKWLLPLGYTIGNSYDVIRARAFVRVRACACACACVWGLPTPTPTPTHPPTHPPGGGPPQISKNSIKIERIEII